MSRNARAPSSSKSSKWPKWPDDPKTLDFELDDELVPKDFLQADIQLVNERHLIFDSNKQLKCLAKSKTWYIDGTFKLCRKPYQQLLSINAFIRREDNAKQVPLLFVLMSGRKKRDYKKVCTINFMLYHMLSCYAMGVVMFCHVLSWIRWNVLSSFYAMCYEMPLFYLLGFWTSPSNSSNNHRSEWDYYWLWKGNVVSSTRSVTRCQLGWLFLSPEPSNLEEGYCLQFNCGYYNYWRNKMKKWKKTRINKTKQRNRLINRMIYA